MTLHPVLISIPVHEGLTGPQRIARQRHYARLALIECARQSGVEPWDWQKNADNVPVPHRGLHWSISHKPMWAAAVIAEHPVGIDVEHIKPRGDGLFDKLASEEEWTRVGGRNWENFFRIWTAKEATLKANGMGIAGLLSCRVVDVLDGSRLTVAYDHREWSIRQTAFKEHLASVTSEVSCEWHIVRST